MSSQSRKNSNGNIVAYFHSLISSHIYFAALNKYWDFTDCDILGLGLVIFVFKSSVAYKNSHSVSAIRPSRICAHT